MKNFQWSTFSVFRVIRAIRVIRVIRGSDFYSFFYIPLPLGGEIKSGTAISHLARSSFSLAPFPFPPSLVQVYNAAPSSTTK